MKRFGRLSRYQLNLKYFRYSIRNIKNLEQKHLLYIEKEKIPPYLNKKFPQGVYAVAIVHDSDYDDYNNVSDFFQEEVRIQSKRKDQKLTPYEYWQNKNLDVASTREGIKQQREILYKEHYECTNFRPSLMVGFGKYFGATSILDISAGWGDRLIGAMALEVEYVGVDPNPKLFKGYREAIEFFDESEEKYVMIHDTFEHAKLPKRKYDLVFTSPPYFDLEEYSVDMSEKDRRKQSYYGRNLEKWYKDFLMVSLKKAFDHLIVGGYMVININEIRNEKPFVVRMIDEMNDYPRAKYLGCISQYTDRSKKSPQPFWIWKKE